MNKWKEHTLKDFYNVKLKNAAQMVDKMSKFSRSFISLNSLNQILLKNKQRHQARALIKWAKFNMASKNNSTKSISDKDSRKANDEKDEII